jgi:hypothetical protein
MAKENYYRTGQVAKFLGISRYKVNALAEAGRIESELRNGMRYFPEREVERLRKVGVPEIPSHIESEPDDEQEEMPAESDEPEDGARRPARTQHPATELYATPSPELVKSQEERLKSEETLRALRNKAESKKFEKDIRDADRAEKADWIEQNKKRQKEERKRADLAYAMSKGPRNARCTATSTVKSKIYWTRLNWGKTHARRLMES